MSMPTEAVLAEMRNSDPPVQYLVRTPKGRLNRLEKHLLEKPWQDAREGVKVKLLAEDGEFYVFAQSDDRVGKERAMLCLSQTQSDWQLIENRAILRDDRACPAHRFDSRRSVSVVDSARGGNPDVAAADKRSAANRS
jgi:hypothetical protein